MSIKNTTIENILIDNNKMVIDGKKYSIPKSKSKCVSQTIINDKIYVNGFEFINGNWVKTIKALWHKWF